MKKVLSIFFFSILITLITLIIVLTTIGLETSKFSNIIAKKIYQTDNNVDLKLNDIKFKFDIKEISLFLEAAEPIINYRKIDIPTKNIKVYMDFSSLIKSKPKIQKIFIDLKEIDINQLKKLSSVIKPSNFKSIIDNKIKRGKLNSKFEIFIDKNYQLKNFIAKGKVSNLYIEVVDDIILKKTNFSFFGDKTDILIKNIFGELEGASIQDGDVKLNINKEISLKSNFISKIRFKENDFLKYDNLLEDFKLIQDISNLEAELNNSISINFDKTYKVKNFIVKNNGKILKANFNFKKFKDNFLLQKNFSELSLINSEITSNFNSKSNNVIISGKYSINDENFLSYKLNNKFEKDKFNFTLDSEYNRDINIDIINYQKPKNLIADLSINLEKKKNDIKIEKFHLKEKNNSIIITDLKLKKNKFISFKKISVKTKINGKTNNDFDITLGNKIIVKGSKFDASNLPKIINKKNKINYFSNINKEIIIDFNNIIAPLSENLKNFKLIGIIEKGKFIKISSKGDFGNNNFLDISMKNDKKNNKKYLEVYSDLPKPLLTEYNFFKGLADGKLLYTSIIDGENSYSKLKIENFKIVNAPGVIKLLSLADLGGLADLAEGEGLSFDILKIDMNNKKGFLKIDEILALGPSISVLMDGYQDQAGLTSLRGTLVPAKSLNKLISKIPVLGDIVIPKEVGEGLFGISFKMKGPTGKIKTTINPIKTITPRFIQKIIERDKKSK
ncbi:MAG: hypothetical protein ACJZ8N_00795 [Candidatus Pelagibacter sp.]|tara:strand:- start:3129 stop:5318 length:2190 start_codon:yes stop_codon:yes gene_type:complete